jgi:tellurite resistance protein
MGFFDQVFADDDRAESGKSPLDVQQAFAAIAVAVSGADGSVEDIEIENVVTYLRRMRLFSDYNTQQFVRLFERVLQVLKRDGPRGLVALARDGLTQDLRETAFALSVDVALADGTVNQAEREMIAFIREELEIPDQLALNITEVMIIKNRG